MIQLVFKRREAKYLLDDRQYARVRQAMEGIMQPDEWGASTVLNIYYDTPQFQLVRRSIERPFYKEKMRIRSYGVPSEDDHIFVELKKKNDGIVYKRRSEMTQAEADALLRGVGQPQTQIERELDFSVRRYGGLIPAVFIGYDREAFYDAHDRDFRITYDKRIRSRWDKLSLSAGDEGDLLLDDNMTLMEIKTAEAIPLWLTSILSEERIFKASFSKETLINDV
ncbi:MAG: polyphosphate polymerase domain-containing protein [Atopobiaceae bacterium]|nr:polyphosphate polymerase domain-containing protein [Atopobiaceae bacterium]